MSHQRAKSRHGCGAASVGTYDCTMTKVRGSLAVCRHRELGYEPGSQMVDPFDAVTAGRQKGTDPARTHSPADAWAQSRHCTHDPSGTGASSPLPAVRASWSDAKSLIRRLDNLADLLDSLEHCQSDCALMRLSERTTDSNNLNYHASTEHRHCQRHSPARSRRSSKL
jgi:hypothetical protein